MNSKNKCQKKNKLALFRIHYLKVVFLFLDVPKVHCRHACLGNTTALSADSKDSSPNKHHPDLASRYAHGEDGLAHADTSTQTKQNSVRAKSINHVPKEKREDSIWERVYTVQR